MKTKTKKKAGKDKNPQLYKVDDLVRVTAISSPFYEWQGMVQDVIPQAGISTLYYYRIKARPPGPVCDPIPVVFSQFDLAKVK